MLVLGEEVFISDPTPSSKSWSACLKYMVSSAVGTHLQLLRRQSKATTIAYIVLESASSKSLQDILQNKGE